MRGSSRAAAAAGQRTLSEAMSADADRARLAEDLFGAVATLDSSAALRRALTDPSRDARAKRGLVTQLFEGKVEGPALSVLTELVGQRWSQDRDLSDTVEDLAVEAVVAQAEQGGRLDAVEDELFRFGRIVTGTPDLRDAVTARERSASDRGAVVQRLLDGKATPETVRLAQQVVQTPRGRRFDRSLRHYLDIAAARRNQLTATVTAAVVLDHTQRDRLARALSSMYDRPVQVNVIVDAGVVGGIRVQIGDEVVDGTILSRLEDARRAMTG